jgi:hypothetical protein
VTGSTAAGRAPSLLATDSSVYRRQTFLSDLGLETDLKGDKLVCLGSAKGGHPATRSGVPRIMGDDAQPPSSGTAATRTYVGKTRTEVQDE